MLPAAGQGALGIEVRADRADLLEALGALADRPTWLAVTAERTVSRAMGGSCSMPLGAHARWQADGTLAIDAIWGDVDGAGALVHVATSVQDVDLGPVAGMPDGETATEGDFARARALGESAAGLLRASGAH